MVEEQLNTNLFVVAHIVLFVVEGLFLNSVLTPKIKRIYAFMGLFSLNLALSLAGIVFVSIKIFFAVPYYVFRTVYIILINKDKLSKRILCIVVMYLFFIFTEMLAISFSNFFEFKSVDIEYIFQFVIMQVMYISLLSMFTYFIKTIDKYNISKKSLLFIMIPVSQFLLLNSTIIFANINDYVENIAINMHLNVIPGFAIYFIGTMVFSLAIDFAVFKGFAENLRLHDTELKLKALEYQNKANLKYYNDLQGNINSMKKIKHDFLNILQIIDSFYENALANETGKSKELYDELVERIKSIQFEKYCENNLVNAIIASKTAECADDHIKFDIMVAMGENTPINDFDLCRVLVNMLDNAIDACRKNSNYEQRKITVEMFTNEGFLYIKTVNPVPSGVSPDFVSTTKTNKKDHGMGLGILKETARFYNGEFIIKAKKEKVYAMFTAAIE